MHAEAESLEQLHKRLGAWCDTGADWLWEATADGRMTFSGRDVDFCGYTPTEVVGLRFEDLVHPEEHERLHRLMATGEGWRDETWHCIAKDGSDIYLRGSAIPDVCHGSVRGYIGTAQLLNELDVAEQVRRKHLAQINGVLEDERLEIVFQPIVGADTGELVGAEALARFDEQMPPPEQMFRMAAAVGLGPALELLAVRRALVAAERLPADIYLSINVSPDTITSPPLGEAILSSSLPPTRLVLEVTEHHSIADYDEVSRKLAAVRKLGVRVAVDDAGAGFASFRHILQLSPELIKLDRSLIEGIDSDLAKRSVAAAVVLMALDLGAEVVAEGVETAEEFQTAKLLGIDAAQGYLLGRPTSDWTTWSEWHALRVTSGVSPVTLRFIQELSLAGRSPATIAAQLNARGERSPSGARWHAASVARQLAPATTISLLDSDSSPATRSRV